MQIADDFNAFTQALSNQAGFALDVENNTTAFKFNDIVVVLDLPDEHEPFLYVYTCLFPVEHKDRAVLFEKLLSYNMPNSQIPGTNTPQTIPRIAFEKETEQVYCWDKFDISTQDMDSFKSRLSIFCETCMALVNEFKKETKTPDTSDELIKESYLRI
ncbi:MAG: hypothetical protein HUK40_00995 [Desulfobacter sp.]|nr:hypothetical protein [Desulfobacter sp.]